MRDLAFSFGFFVSIAAALFFAGMLRFVLSMPPDEYERNRQAVGVTVEDHHLLVAKWIGTAAGVAGALIVALNVGAVVWGFALFLVSSLLWSAVAAMQREPSLLVLQATFTLINLVGIWRWSGILG